MDNSNIFAAALERTGGGISDLIAKNSMLTLGLLIVLVVIIIFLVYRLRMGNEGMQNLGLGVGGKVYALQDSDQAYFTRGNERYMKMPEGFDSYPRAGSYFAQEVQTDNAGIPDSCGPNVDNTDPAWSELVAKGNADTFSGGKYSDKKLVKVMTGME